MRVIITGGTGLIGNPLVADLLKDKHEVVVLTRNPEKAVKSLPAGTSQVKWDGKSPEGWGDLVEAAGAIVNLAGDNLSSGRWSPQKKLRIVNSRVNAGKAICQALEIASKKPEVVIQSSAVGYYGSQGDNKITEKTPPGHDFVAQGWKEWEESTAPVEAMGVRRAIIRTGVVLSTKGGALPRLALPYKLFVGGPIGNGSQWFPWIHIIDEVRAIRFLIDRKDARGVFNVCAPFPLTNRGFGKVLASIIHRPAIFPVPAFVLKLIFGEMAGILLASQREIPKHLLEMGFTFQYPKAEAALQDLYAQMI